MSVYSNEIIQMVNKLLRKKTFNSDGGTYNFNDLDLSRYYYLKLINQSDQITLTDISNTLDRPFNDVRKEISLMIKDDYLIKEPMVNDKRKKRLLLTQKGQLELEVFNEDLEEIISFIIKDFSVNEEKAVLKFLSRMNQLTFNHSSKNKKRHNR